MLRVALLAFAVTRVGAVNAPASTTPQRAYVTITPQRPHMVLGVEREMTLFIDVHDNEQNVAFAPERATASIGTIASVTPIGVDHFTTRYLAPAGRFPQATIIVVDLVGGGHHLRATARLPLYAATEMPFRTSAGAAVSVRIEDQTFGPVRADAQGKVAIPIVVPPGVRDGVAQATDGDGNTRETPIDLQPTPFEQIMILAAPQLEVGSFGEVSTFGVTARGEPIARGRIVLRASEGMVHPLGTGAPGEERFLVEAPGKLGTGALRLTATAIDVAPEPLLVLEKRAEITVPLVPGPPERLTLSPSRDRLFIGSGAVATIGVAARDRHENLASCAGTVVSVNGRPVALTPDGKGCGQVLIHAPSKPSLGGSVEIEARLGALHARTFVRVTPSPAVRLAASVSTPEVVGDGKQSVEVRVQAFDRTGRPTIVPELTWQAAGGRVGPQHTRQLGNYVTEFTPNHTQTARAEVLVVKGAPSLSATTIVQVEPPRATLRMSARVGLFTNFGGMAGPIATIEALRALPGRASFWSAGLMLSVLHNDLTTTAGGTVGLPDTLVEINQVPCLAIAKYRLPVPLGVNLSAGVGAGISFAQSSFRPRDRSWPAARSTARALALRAGAEAAFPLAPGELVVGAHYLWVDLGRTSQGDQIQGNSVGFVGDVGYLMAW